MEFLATLFQLDVLRLGDEEYAAIAVVLFLLRAVVLEDGKCRGEDE